MKKIALALILVFGLCGGLYAQEKKDASLSPEAHILFLQQKVKILEQQLRIKDLEQEVMEKKSLSEDLGLEGDLDAAAKVMASANSYTINNTPNLTADYLVGIDDSAGTWAINRFDLADLQALYLASAPLTADPTITDATPTLTIQDSDDAAGTAAF